jgi:Flp pilus assembly pilin Flp
LARCLRDERGTEALEWALVCGLIVVGVIIVIVLMGSKVTDLWNDASNEPPPPSPTTAATN